MHYCEAPPMHVFFDMDTVDPRFIPTPEAAP